MIDTWIDASPISSPVSSPHRVPLPLYVRPVPISPGCPPNDVDNVDAAKRTGGCTARAMRQYAFSRELQIPTPRVSLVACARTKSASLDRLFFFNVNHGGERAGGGPANSRWPDKIRGYKFDMEVRGGAQQIALLRRGEQRAKQQQERKIFKNMRRNFVKIISDVSNCAVCNLTPHPARV